MSVVNQMLKDLDRRQTGDQAVFTQHLPPPSSSPGWMKILIGVGLLVIIGLTVTVYLLMQNSAPQPVVATPSTPIVAPPAAPMPITVVAEAPIEQPAVAPPPPPTPAAAPVSAPTVSATRKALAQSEAIKTARPAAIPAVSPPEVDTVKAPAVSPPRIDSAKAPASPSPAVAPAENVEPPRAVTSGPTKIDVRPSNITNRTAESEFTRAVALINQGRAEDARAALASALKLDGNHQGARQTLAVLLVESGSAEAAEALLAEGLRLNPQQSNFAVLAARLKLQRGDTLGALEVLRQHGNAAVKNAEYRAFTAALLQRLARHPESIDEYRAALTLAPGTGVWWMGLGLSYEANGQPREAAEAFKRAQGTSSLSTELAEFVDRKLQTLR